MEKYWNLVKNFSNFVTRKQSLMKNYSNILQSLSKITGEYLGLCFKISRFDIFRILKFNPDFHSTHISTMFHELSKTSGYNQFVGDDIIKAKNNLHRPVYERKACSKDRR